MNDQDRRTEEEWRKKHKPNHAIYVSLLGPKKDMVAATEVWYDADAGELGGSWIKPLNAKLNPEGTLVCVTIPDVQEVKNPKQGILVKSSGTE